MRLAVVAATLLLVAGCGGHQATSLLGSDPEPSSSTTPSTGVPELPTQLVAQRADAIRHHRRAVFMAAVSREDPGFVAQQRLSYRNLSRLPIRELSFAVDEDGSVTRTLRLAGQPAEVGPAGFALQRHDGVLRVVPAGVDFRPEDPWDLVDLAIRHRGGAVVVSDHASAARADAVLADLVPALADVRSTLRSIAAPVAPLRGAVVYVFSDPAVVSTYARVPGADGQHLGAITYPVDADAEVYRVALLPDAFDAGDAGTRQLLRHELVHVALGASASAAPTWVTEGVAEYAAQAPVPPSQQRIATAALAQARTGRVDLVDRVRFNDGDQSLHYAAAWMACDELAATRGPAVLGALLRATSSGRPAREVTGLTLDQLEQRAASRIVREFG